MHYIIDFDNRQDYLFAHVRGQDSVANSLDYWARVRDACEKHNQHKVLVVEELRNAPDNAGVYQVATTLPEIFFDFPIKIAFVTPEHGPDESFGVDISRKRGLDVQSFSDEDKAINWLSGA
ncbi:MAG TPA: hypothetical protein VFP95_05335 [Gammaproteobacteria bacterium]|nr:hypothetical protein [Gammaproteobacteria bacterium]